MPGVRSTERAGLALPAAVLDLEGRAEPRLDLADVELRAHLELHLAFAGQPPARPGSFPGDGSWAAASDSCPNSGRSRPGRRETARGSAAATAGPVARPQQGLPAGRLGHGFVEPQQLPAAVCRRRPAARRARRRCRQRGPAAVRRRAPRDCWAARPPESASPRGPKPAAAPRPIAFDRRRPARGNRPAA